MLFRSVSQSRYLAYVNSYGIKGWVIKFQEVSSGQYTPYLFVINHLDVANFQLYTYKIKSLIEDASSIIHSPSTRSKKWQDFYNFKNQNLTMVEIRDPDNYKKILVDKDLDYGYAITAHKSQGSTYTHTFSNLANIVYGNNVSDLNPTPINTAEMINRLFYVAASRAKESLTILF